MNVKQVYALVPYIGNTVTERNVKIDPKNSYYENPQNELYAVMNNRQLPDSQKIRLYEDLLKRHLSKIGRIDVDDSISTPQPIQSQFGQTMAHPQVTHNPSYQMTTPKLNQDYLPFPSTRLFDQQNYNYGKVTVPPNDATVSPSDVRLAQQQSLMDEMRAKLDSSLERMDTSDTATATGGYTAYSRNAFLTIDDILNSIRDRAVIDNTGIRDLNSPIHRAYSRSNKQKLISWLQNSSIKITPPGANFVITELAKKLISPDMVKHLITNKDALEKLRKDYNYYKVKSPVKQTASHKSSDQQSGSGLTWNGQWIDWMRY